MPQLLTPRQVARAIDVSESSVKRWCDKGLIPTQYTAGGHRRISRPAIIQFIRQGRHELTHPEALGMPATSGQSVRVIHRAKEQLAEALIAGDELRCRQIVFDLYLAEHSVGSICDEAVAEAFRQIGDCWECGEVEIYQERRACEITLRVLHELRSLLIAPRTDAPLAIGCATSGDQYNLGTTMAELVLLDAKWNAVSLGDNLPFATIAAAIRDQHPNLFWLSCSHIEDEAAFLDGYRQLQEEFTMQVPFVLGGFGLTEELRRQMKYSAYCDNMQHLESFAQSLQSAMQPKS